MRFNLLIFLVSISIFFGCEDNNSSSPSNNNNNGGGGGSNNGICVINIDDTIAPALITRDTIFFPNPSNCTFCVSEAIVRENIDDDGDGQNDDTEIVLLDVEDNNEVDISFDNGIFQGVNNYSMWDSTSGSWIRKSDFRLSVRIGARVYYGTRVKEVSVFNLTTYSSSIGQRISGNFTGTLTWGVFTGYRVPVNVYFDVPVTSN